MIKLFGITDKDFNSNGDLVLLPKKAVVHNEDNGDFYLEIETDDSYVSELTEGKIIVANTPQGEQAFRITNPSVQKHQIKIKAYHVFYDSKNYLIKDSYVVRKNCNGALDHLNMATDSVSPFETISNVETIQSFRCVRKSLYEAIQTVLERWGGHLTRNNFKIEIRDTIGQDRGVTIRYAKNLKEIERTQSWENVVTKLLPVGKNGILLNSLDPSADVYLYSDTSYKIPYTKSVNFSQDYISEEDYMDSSGNLNEMAYKQALVRDLRMIGTVYLFANIYPKTNYTLKAALESIVEIGDTIHVFDEDLGIDVFTSVIKYEYDCILKRYNEIEFGNFKKKLSGLFSNIESKAEEIALATAESTKIVLGKELKDATDKILGTLSNSYVIYDGNKILILDKLPKETATNVIIINNSGIGFSQNGINGPFNSAWTIDGTLDMQAINVINLTADLIKGGTLKLGAALNQSGVFELYDDANTLIGMMDKDGFKMFSVDGSYIVINASDGFVGYNRLGEKIYWVSQNGFHMTKAFVESEAIICKKIKLLPMTLTDNQNNIVSDGVAIVSYQN